MKATINLFGIMNHSSKMIRRWHLMLMLLCVQAVTVGAATGFMFEQTPGGLRVIGYDGPGGAVQIPLSHNGDPVISIGSSTFFVASLSTQFTSVVIPSSITSIEPLAFLGLDGVPIIFTGPAPEIDQETFTGVDNPIIRAPGDQTGFRGSQWQNVPIVLGGFDFWRFENGFDLLRDTPETIVPGLGVTLFEVYAFNLDLSSTEPVQTVQTRWLGGQLTLEFFAGRDDIQYSVQVSQDLLQWSASAHQPTDSNGFTRHSFPASSFNGFIRVVITPVP